MSDYKASVLILTFNRPDELERNIAELSDNLSEDVEIVVVDNHSDNWNDSLEERYGQRVRFLFMESNLGVGARNKGVEACSSEIVFTLDDDVFGLQQNSIDLALQKFSDDEKLSAINFKVIDDETEKQINWIHHRKRGEWGDREFLTYEISEGAVVIKRSHFLDVGGYPEYFFISHEGPFLALALMNKGKRISYFPDITVRHAHSEAGRVSWRRYYYDARNVIWLAFQYLPLRLVFQKCSVELGALLLYALRDGFFKFWLKGVVDGVSGLCKRPEIKRSPINKSALREYRKIKKHNAGVLYMISIRIFNRQRKVRI